MERYPGPAGRDPTTTRSSPPPSLYEDTIYGGTGGGLYAIDTTGDVLWTEPLETGVSTSIGVDASGLYVPSKDVLQKLDHQGWEQWAVDLAGPSIRERGRMKVTLSR